MTASIQHLYDGDENGFFSSVVYFPSFVISIYKSVTYGSFINILSKYVNGINSEMALNKDNFSSGLRVSLYQLSSAPASNRCNIKLLQLSDIYLTCQGKI